MHALFFTILLYFLRFCFLDCGTRVLLWRILSRSQYFKRQAWSAPRCPISNEIYRVCKGSVQTLTDCYLLFDGMWRRECYKINYRAFDIPSSRPVTQNVRSKSKKGEQVDGLGYFWGFETSGERRFSVESIDLFMWNSGLYSFWQRNWSWGECYSLAKGRENV